MYGGDDLFTGIERRRHAWPVIVLQLSSHSSGVFPGWSIVDSQFYRLLPWIGQRDQSFILASFSGVYSVFCPGIASCLLAAVPWQAEPCLGLPVNLAGCDSD